VEIALRFPGYTLDRIWSLPYEDWLVLAAANDELAEQDRKQSRQLNNISRR